MIIKFKKILSNEKWSFLVPVSWRISTNLWTKISLECEQLWEGPGKPLDPGFHRIPLLTALRVTDSRVVWTWASVRTFPCRFRNPPDKAETRLFVLWHVGNWCPLAHQLSRYPLSSLLAFFSSFSAWKDCLIGGRIREKFCLSPSAVVRKFP